MVDRISGTKVIGIKQTIKAIKGDKGETVYLAKNADEKLTAPIAKLAEDHSLKIVYVDSMKELGKLCGIDVGAAAALTIKEQ